MNRAYIRQLAKFLSPESSYFAPSGAVLSAADRGAIALADPKFGWNFVKSFMEDGREFPSTVVNPLLLQANSHLREPDDDEMEQAMMLTHPVNTRMRHVLQGLLISEDVTLRTIGTWMGIPLKVVRLFDQLFFNVRDRRDEPGYIVQLLNPDGIRLDRGSDDEELLLLRAGVLSRAKGVIGLARIGLEESEKSIEELCRESGREIALRAATVARHGSDQDMDSNSVTAAMRLFLAPKRPDRDKSGFDDDQHGLGSISPHYAVMETLKQICQPGVEKMIKTASEPSVEGAKPARDPLWFKGGTPKPSGLPGSSNAHGPESSPDQGPPAPPKT